MRRPGRSAALRAALWAVAVVALANTVAFSGASFTSNRTTNPGNVFAGGTLLVVNSRDGQVVVGASPIAPGQTQSGELTLTNTGSVAADCRVARAAAPVDVPASPPLSAALTLTIVDLTSATTVWSGTMASFDWASLGTLAPGESRDYRVSVQFPAASATPELQGASTALTLRFSGASL